MSCLVRALLGASVVTSPDAGHRTEGAAGSHSRCFLDVFSLSRLQLLLRSPNGLAIQEKTSRKLCPPLFSRVGRCRRRAQTRVARLWPAIPAPLSNLQFLSPRRAQRPRLASRQQRPFDAIVFSGLNMAGSPNNCLNAVMHST